MFTNLVFDLIFIIIGIFFLILFFKKYYKNDKKIKKGLVFLILGLYLVSMYTYTFIDGLLTHSDGCCRCYEYWGSNGYSPQVCCNCAWPFSYK